jgi:cell wall-associated NlpC family hydrolase
MTDFPVPAETAKAPKGSAARLIQVAKSQVGYIEGPKDNETKYGAYTKANFQPWCGSFVMWCANEAGVKVPNTVYTPGGAAAFKKANSWIDGDIADPEPGDIAYFDFPSDGVDRISHVGIVIEDNEDGTVWCIEGNTSSKKSGSQRNGGEACKQLRAYKKNKAGVQVSIVGFGRPKFKVGGTAKPVASATGVCPTCGK